MKNCSKSKAAQARPLKCLDQLYSLRLPQNPRILIIRTDRMGDLILSTPALRALRSAFPGAHLALMVQPSNLPLVENHPVLNEVIAYDSKGAHRDLSGTLKLAGELRRKRFDLALILHTTNRVVFLSWLAGIPRRIGYARKLSWLLTEPVPYEKRHGQKHELDYTLDLVRRLGVPAEDKTLEIGLVKEGKPFVEKWLRDCGIGTAEPLVVLHPGASCPSKRWPVERFAAVADRLHEQAKARVVVIAGPDQKELGEQVKSAARSPVTVPTQPLTLEQLPWLLAQARCLISNDSGPVHLSCAVGTPVVSIFGRWGGGLSPKRWGPTLPGSVVLHYDVGCRPCLAHRCQIGFQCLQAVTVDEVVNATSQILNKKTPS